MPSKRIGPEQESQARLYALQRQARTTDLRDKIIKFTMSLSWTVYRRNRPPVTKAEWRTESTIRLIQSLDNYDPSKGPWACWALRECHYLALAVFRTMRRELKRQELEGQAIPTTASLVTGWEDEVIARVDREDKEAIERFWGLRTYETHPTGLAIMRELARYYHETGDLMTWATMRRRCPRLAIGKMVRFWIDSAVVMIRRYLLDARSAVAEVSRLMRRMEVAACPSPSR
jgi:hypothetical protein